MKSHFIIFLTSLCICSFLYANPSEKLINESADLKALNLKLNQAYNLAIKNAEVAQAEKIKRDQHKWRTQLDQCTTHDCLHEAIMNRITILDQLVKK